MIAGGILPEWDVFPRVLSADASDIAFGGRDDEGQHIGNRRVVERLAGGGWAYAFIELTGTAVRAAVKPRRADQRIDGRL